MKLVSPGLLLALAVLSPGSRALSAEAGGGKIVPRFNAYFTPAFTDAGYQRAAAAKVMQGWKPPAGAPKGKKTVLIAQIASDGKLAGLREHLVTGFKPWDAAATAAVERAAPFSPLPKSWPHPTMEVHFHFEAAAK